MDKYKVIAIVALIIVLLIIIVFTSKYRIIKIYEKYLKVGNKANLSGKQIAFISKQNLELDDLEFALTDVKLGDAIKIKSQGIEYSYIIESISILENDEQLTIPAATGKHLLISTCYTIKSLAVFR